MKKLLKWVLPAFIGIVPALGMDPFEHELAEGSKALSQPGIIYSVNRTFQKGSDLIAFVSVTPREGDPMVVKVKTLFNRVDILDAIDGRGAYGQETGELLDANNGNVLCEKYTKPQILRYIEISNRITAKDLNGAAIIDPFLSLGIIPFGVVVDECLEGQFQRPDGSIFRVKNESRVIAKGLHNGIELTTLEQFFGLDFGTVVNIHKMAVGEGDGDEVKTSEDDPILYQIVVNESLHQFAGWECERCYQGGGGIKKKTYHVAVGFDYMASDVQLMMRVAGKEDVLYPNGQREWRKAKKANGQRNDSSGEHNAARPEFIKIA